MPGVIVQNAVLWLSAVQAASTKESLDRALSRYRHPDIKQALESLFNEKCAYCESQIAHISWSRIEHFRPKANWRYRHLAFTWSNLLLSCEICNSSAFKGTKFPSKANGGYLIDPTFDDPSLHFEFEYDVKSKLALVLPKSLRGRTTEAVLGLNRKPLVKKRSEVVRRLLFIKSKMHADAEAAALIALALSNDGEYLAFARRYLQ